MLYPEIEKELLAMEQIDQQMRCRAHEDPGCWDWSIDQKHTSRMKELVAQIGWPTATKVGKKASQAAWLLVQHADHDVAFQKECLALMKLVPADNIDIGDIAYLEDRTRVNTRQPQLYGTQFTEVDGKHMPREIESPERVDERRLRMGLGTLEEGIKHMNEKYGVKK